MTEQPFDLAEWRNRMREAIEQIRVAGEAMAASMHRASVEFNAKMARHEKDAP